MNKTLHNIISKTFKPFNKAVTEGSGREMLKHAPQFLDNLITDTIKTMDGVGLEYHGWRELSMKEEFHTLFTNKEKKTVFDVSMSDFYLIELRFMYRGTPIIRHIYLPFCERGNLLRISDTFYHIVPVLSDTVISPSDKEVFVRLLKDKLTYKRYMRNFVINGDRVPCQIVYSNAYRTAGRAIIDNLGTAYPSISLYILGEMGLRAALKKYANVDDFIISRSADTEAMKNAYRIYESDGIKPRGIKEYNYVSHGVKILIPLDCVNDSNIAFLDNFIIGIIYTLDVLPNISDDVIEVLDNHDVKNEIQLWRLSLGKIIFKNGYSIDKINTEMHDHFNTLQNYIDSIIKEKLKSANYRIETYFDLLAVILQNFNSWLLTSKEYNSNIDHRYIDIKYYLLYDIIAGLNKTLGTINKKGSKKELSEKEIVTIFNNNITKKRIFNITSNNLNLALMLVDYSGDIMYPKITCQLADQSQGDGVNRGTGSQFPESTRYIRGYSLYVGSLNFLSKGTPGPTFKINPWLEYDIRTGKIHTPEEKKPIIDKLDKLFLGRAEYSNKILNSEIDTETLDSDD